MGFYSILGQIRLGVMCGSKSYQVVCEVRDFIWFGFAIEVVCNLHLGSGMTGRVPRSPNVTVYMTEKEALFAEWECSNS